MASKKVEVVRENQTGRNKRFRDGNTGREMTRPEFVREIRRGNYPDYHVRQVEGVPTPASNPDRSKKNNLG